METEFCYISPHRYLNTVFFILVDFVIFPVCAASFKLYPLFIFPAVLISVAVFSVLEQHLSNLKGQFEADEEECTFTLSKKTLHFRYDKLKNCQLVSRPLHNRYGNLTGYEIDLKIIDSYQNVHHIRQRLAAEHTSEVYPMPIPEEVENSELTEIRDFIKSKLKPDAVL